MPNKEYSTNVTSWLIITLYLRSSHSWYALNSMQYPTNIAFDEKMKLFSSSFCCCCLGTWIFKQHCQKSSNDSHWICSYSKAHKVFYCRELWNLSDLKCRSWFEQLPPKIAILAFWRATCYACIPRWSCFHTLFGRFARGSAGLWIELVLDANPCEVVGKLNA